MDRSNLPEVVSLWVDKVLPMFESQSYKLTKWPSETIEISHKNTNYSWDLGEVSGFDVKIFPVDNSSQMNPEWVMDKFIQLSFWTEHKAILWYVCPILVEAIRTNLWNLFV